MGWNPYTDQKNRAYSSILTSLFPEQTKTLPRIIVWSIVFLLDLILVIGGAMYLGWLEFGSYHSQNTMKLVSAGLIALAVGLFWLQGVIWGAVTRFFQKRKELD